MEILEFVKADQVDPIYLESSYYVAPDEGGEKAYACCSPRLKDSATTAWPRWRCTIASTSSCCGRAPRGFFRTPCITRTRSGKWRSFAPTPSLVKEKELAMAKMLISSLEENFEPQKYHDAYRDNLKKMIEDKIEGRNVVEGSGGAFRAGDRYHGSAQEESGPEAQAGGGGHRRGGRRDGSGAEEAGAEE